MDPGLEAALAELDKDPAEGEVEAGTPSANIEPEVSDDASFETQAEMDNGPIDVQSKMDEEVDQRQLETEASLKQMHLKVRLRQVDSVAREPELTLREPEAEKEASQGEFKDELDAAMDDSEKDDMAEATRPNQN
ncbi:hypothetical protein L7F22_015327 [Adiantum nelumboides]|nr:hypothetical protein [Adiantum nelumboides]